MIFAFDRGYTSVWLPGFEFCVFAGFCWIMTTAMSAGPIPDWIELEDSSQEYPGIQSSVKGSVDTVYRQPLLVS